MEARKPSEKPPLQNGQIIGEKPTPVFEDGPDEDCTCEYGIEIIDVATRHVGCRICTHRWTATEEEMRGYHGAQP